MREQGRHIAGLLYEGVLSPQDWFAGMAAFNAAVGGFNFHALTVDTCGAAVLESIASIAPGNEKAVQEYDQHYAFIDERAPIAMQLGPGQIMLDHEHFSERHMSRSALYVDCLAPQGMKYTMGLMLRANGGVAQYVGFMRATDQRPFSDAERAFALQVAPEAMRAARLREQARELARRAALGLAALDTLAQAVAVVDAQCRIHYSNPAADRLLASAGAVLVRHGCLGCADGDTQARWQGAVSTACARRGPAMAGTLRAAGGDRAVVITALPLHPCHPAAQLHEPLALVVLHDPAAPRGLDAQLVTAALGVSPTEARLALLLATGRSVKEFAAIHGMSWHTARSHHKNLLRKTGCHRQVELVRLLQGLNG